MMAEIPMKRLPALAGLILAASCASPGGAPGRVAYEPVVRDLVKKRCGECHGPRSPSLPDFKKDAEGWKKKDLGPRMDTYADLMIFVNGSDTGALMRRLDDGANSPGGKPGNMHEHLGDDDRERAANLAIVKRWVGGWSLKRAAQISDEERRAVLAPER
jgi:mono/diheme cytochrome c family protein